MTIPTKPYTSRHILRSYRACEKIFSNVRSPSKGKPLKCAGARMFKETGCDGRHVFVVRNYGERVFTIDMDDVLTLEVIPRVSSKYIVETLAGLYCYHKGENRYRLRMYFGAFIKNQIKDLPLAFPGMKWNLNTGECLNARLDPKRERIPEAYNAWQNKMREYMKGWKVRARIGAIEQTVREHLPNELHYRAWHISDDDFLKYVTEQDYGFGMRHIVMNSLSWYERNSLQQGRELHTHVYEKALSVVYNRFRADLLVRLGAVKIVQEEVRQAA